MIGVLWLVSFTLLLSADLGEEQRNHIGAGWWIVAVIFTVLPFLD
jgi:hypothetical protein